MSYSIPAMERMLNALKGGVSAPTASFPFDPKIMEEAASLQQPAAPSEGAVVLQQPSVESPEPPATVPVVEEAPKDFKDFAPEGKLRAAPSLPKNARDIEENIVERDADGRILKIITYKISGEQSNGA